MSALVSLAAPVPPVETPRWSSSDPVHYCLRDVERTQELLTAIARTVRPGDTVVEVGPGSGILSLAAADAGAARVIAVELDLGLIDWLRVTVDLNGFGDRITVVHGNALTADLPRSVDVLIAELIDTALLDESQVPVLNGLRARGVIDPRTRLIPWCYTTYVELVEVDPVYYGYRIVGPIHDWRTLRQPGSGWHRLRVRPLTERAMVAAVDFRRPIEPRLDRDLTLRATGDGRGNGVRLTGSAHLAPGLDLGATNALNGDKILPLLDPIAIRAGDRVAVRLGYEMGGGLGTFALREGRER